MSILLGLQERSNDLKGTKDDEDDLLMFGYGCKLYRDDAKALLEDSGQLLIPWMGDSSLMIDRYDIRNRLEDKSQFGLKSSIPYRISEEEEELEEKLDVERYFALGVDVREEELREEENKRLSVSNGYAAVGFSYDKEPVPPSEEPPLLMSEPSIPEHPPTSSVDITHGEGGPFVVPKGLVVPEGMRVPATYKLHSIIERTAFFINQQGPQMEIIIKAKQKFNPFFSFLDFGDALNPYYRHLLNAVSAGTYSPGSQRSEERSGKYDEGTASLEASKEERDGVLRKDVGDGDEKGDRQGKTNDETVSLEDVVQSSEGEEEDSDDEGYELHPLLRVSTTPRSKPSTPTPPPPSNATGRYVTTTAENGRTSNLLESTAFYTKRLSVNAAPSLEQEVRVAQSQVDPYGASSSSGHYQHPYGSYPTEHSDGRHHDGYYGGTPYYDAYAYQMQTYQQNLQAYYHALSVQHVQSSSSSVAPTPPPPDLQPIVDKTAQYVAKNDDGFERTVIEKHAGDPRFSFLNPWDQYYSYYKKKKLEYKDKIAREEEEKENYLKSKPNVQRLDSSGAISFKLQPKSSKLVGASVDLSVQEEGEGEGNGGEDRDYTEETPDPKRPRYMDSEEREGGGEEDEEEGDKIDNKVQEFLSTVKAMFGTD